MPIVYITLYCYRELYKHDWLPEQTYFVGYARSKISICEIRKRCEPYLKVPFCLCFVDTDAD